MCMYFYHLAMGGLLKNFCKFFSNLTNFSNFTKIFLLQVHSMGDLLRMIYTFSNVVIY